MLFAGTETAARIERAECDLLRGAAAAFAAAEPRCDPFVREIAGGVAVFTEEGMPFNKLAGLGFAGMPDPAELDQVEEELRRRTSRLQVEVSSLGDPGVAALLSRRGYTLEGIENVLGRVLPATDAGAAPADGIDIVELAAGDQDPWTDVVLVGFQAPDEIGVPSHESFERGPLERAMRVFARVDGMRRYLVTRHGHPAGGGSLRLSSEGVAQLCGAATLPAHRRRGIQSLLLSRRLADAAAAGCDVAVVTTQPGSKSHENAHRRGFALLYVRSVLVKEW